jgi:parvulin-like peptidyl-prolyl isomerase
MIPIRKPSLFLAAAALWVFTGARPACAGAGGAAPLFADPVVATGKGIEVKRSAVEDAFITEKTVAQEQNMTIAESDRTRIESDILLHMVLDKILVQKATEAEKASVAEEVAKYLDQLRKASPNEELFQQQIKATGKTLEEIKAAFTEKRLARTVIVRELAPSNTLSDDAVKKFYEDEKNAALFAIPEAVHVAHIFISALDPDTQRPLPPDQKMEKKKLAEEVKAKADKVDDFALLARAYSEDSGTKDKGGEYTFARHSMSPMLEGFEAAAFSMKTNQISDLVESPYGWHIIKLLEKLPPSKVTLAKATDAIKLRLANEQINKKLPDYVKKIEAEYNVKFLDPNFSPGPLVPLEVSATNAPPAASLAPVALPGAARK